MSSPGLRSTESCNRPCLLSFANSLTSKTTRSRNSFCRGSAEDPRTVLALLRRRIGLVLKRPHLEGLVAAMTSGAARSNLLRWLLGSRDLKLEDHVMRSQTNIELRTFWADCGEWLSDRRSMRPRSQPRDCRWRRFGDWAELSPLS